MLTSLTLDDELLAKAKALTGLQCTTALINEALGALIEREGHSSGEEPMEIAQRDT
ncbi:type II toxin-antitoxin system VapB family antitoxin [Pandoraea sp. NPDC087047]|uniref:type II toxin-antitoxin system VapB family antitoxin n=1 Tax=Pandoraea sp. NPDC087047 TaxID=3364390 RepID=UPI00381A0D03